MHISQVTDTYMTMMKIHSQHPSNLVSRLVLKLNLLTCQLVIQVLQKDPDDLDYRQDQRAKSQGACVVSGQEK